MLKSLQFYHFFQLERNHTSQKCLQRILKLFAKKGDKILDTHLGSGTIAVACHNVGFDLTACEIDKKYFKIAKKYIEETISEKIDTKIL